MNTRYQGFTAQANRLHEQKAKVKRNLLYHVVKYVVHSNFILLTGLAFVSKLMSSRQWTFCNKKVILNEAMSMTIK